MFTYKFYVNTPKNNTLMLRITNNRKKSELSLGFHISKEELAEILSGSPSRKNQQLASLVSIWQGKIEEVKIDLVKDQKNKEDPKVIKDIIQTVLFGKKELVAPQMINNSLFAPYFLDFSERKGNKRTRDIYLATLSRMKAYDPQLNERHFEDITIRWLTDFDSFLSKTAPSQNARNIHFRNIRTVINAAIDDELTSHYPFRRFKIRPTPTKKRSLSVENIQKVFNVEGLEDWEVKYLDFFKLSFMLIGINVVDLCNLSEIVDGRIEYVRAKTHKPYSIKVEPEALEIIKRHKGARLLLDFSENYANYRHFYNNLCIGLRSIKSKLGLKELTTYWARHTWATIAASLDIPKDTIAAALGHGGNTVTDIYINFDQRKVDEANRRVLDWVLYGKR